MTHAPFLNRRGFLGTSAALLGTAAVGGLARPAMAADPLTVAKG